MNAINELTTWLKEKDKTNMGFDQDTDLIEQGLVDSLTFVEYILMIEELSDCEVTIGDEIIDQVRTLNRVMTNFFQHTLA